MSAFAFALVIIIGLPLILVGVGFVVIATKIFNGGNSQVERAQTLEAARQLERTLSRLETRLTALEDIILSGRDAQGGDKNE